MVGPINIRKDLNLRFTVWYSAAQGFYWSAFCSSLNFASVFLLSKSFRNSQIGIVLAVANILAVFLQPLIAGLADRSEKITINGIIIAMAGTAGAFAAARCFLSHVSPVLAALFILELTVLFSLQPFLNSLGMRIINQGIEINFGFSRGFGSLSYAVLSVLLGILVQQFGTDSLSVISVGLYSALCFVIFFFSKRQFALKSGTVQAESFQGQLDSKSANPESVLSFLSHNKRFAALMVAVSLTFCSHSMINNYFIQITEHVGGTSKEMGIATGIAAAIELPAMMLCDFLVRKIRCSSILKFSLVFFTVKTVITLMATSVRMLYAAQVLQFCSYALFIPASIYYVNEVIKEEDLAKGQAFMTAATTFGGVTASLFGGLLLDSEGVGTMLLVGVIAAALGAAIGFYATQRVEVKECAPDKTQL